MSYSVFFDFDGTLLPAGKKQISDRVLKALQEAQARGHKIFLNTGRPFSFVDTDAVRGFCFDGILCGGGYVNVNGKVLLAETMSPEETKSILTHFYGRDTVVLIEGERAVWAAYGDETNSFPPLTDLDEILKICNAEPITKLNVLAYLNKEDLDFIRQYGDPIQRDDVVCTEIMQKGHDKGYLITKTVALLGLDPKKVIAVGDSTNDLAMLKAAPISVVMGQATEQVKQYAKYVTASVEEDGAALLLENLP
ncbi:MAG: HAD family hydrolase [Clostridia bacterium]|nr:HAD family hydrolase [Clostridia bacterium]